VIKKALIFFAVSIAAGYYYCAILDRRQKKKETFVDVEPAESITERDA